MAPKDLLDMTPEEYRGALAKLTPLEAMKLGAMISHLIKDAEQGGYIKAREELASTVAGPGGLRMAHPEDYCHRCFGPNLSWAAPSPLWNQVMRNGDINGPEPFEGIICPMCFMTLTEEKGVADVWRLDAQRIHVDLQYVTPSGRRWDPVQWLWIEQTDREA